VLHLDSNHDQNADADRCQDLTNWSLGHVFQ